MSVLKRRLVTVIVKQLRITKIRLYPIAVYFGTSVTRFMVGPSQGQEGGDSGMISLWCVSHCALIQWHTLPLAMYMHTSVSVVAQLKSRYISSAVFRTRKWPDSWFCWKWLVAPQWSAVVTSNLLPYVRAPLVDLHWLTHKIETSPLVGCIGVARRSVSWAALISGWWLQYDLGILVAA